MMMMTLGVHWSRVVPSRKREVIVLKVKLELANRDRNPVKVNAEINNELKESGVYKDREMLL